MVIYHIAIAGEWQAGEKSGFYAPASFAEEGFIHCSFQEQILPVANAFYHGQRGLLLLEIDAASLGDSLIVEDLYDHGEEFPHIYGKLPASAVSAIYPFTPNDDGIFEMPAALPSVTLKITVETAQIADIPAIKQVLSSTWHQTYQHILSPKKIEKITSEWHTPERLRRNIESGKIYSGVAKTELDEIVGMITVRFNDPTIYISQLYVLPQFQRKGIGAQLLDEGRKAFPFAKKARLEVAEQNPIGRAFYRKAGFIEVGNNSVNLFGVTLHSIILERALKPH